MKKTSFKRFFPIGIALLISVNFLQSFKNPASKSTFSVQDFGQLTVLNNGRTKPIDTIARNSLLVIHGKQYLRDENKKITAIEWALEVMTEAPKADQRKLFRIHDPDVLGILHKRQEDGKYYSYKDIKEHFSEIEKAARAAEQVEAQGRNRFQKAVLHLYRGVSLYQSLKNTLTPAYNRNVAEEVRGFQKNLPTAIKLLQRIHADSDLMEDESILLLLGLVRRFQFLSESALFLSLPPYKDEADQNWRNHGNTFIDALQSGPFHPLTLPYAKLVDAVHQSDKKAFKENVQLIDDHTRKRLPKEWKKARFEFRFNHIQPFSQAIWIYVMAILLIFISWLTWPQTLSKTASWLIVIAFMIHTFALLSRMHIQDRPPVTNLYSSAVFVGWVAVLMGIILELIHKKGFANLVSAIIGATTLVVAHHLSLEGDTLEMMQAVLDSNFWLGTHVVTITIGYGATFVAGILAHVYIIRRFFLKSPSQELDRSLYQMTYGVIGFSLFLSFIGTTLGGIWADQSWGRFWGWDPKENGAFILVLWNSIMLHARMAGLIRERGFMISAVFGNIVTSFSWFGVNMLGIGLHSYGFMDKAFFWLILFITSQAVIMGLGALPQKSKS